MDEPTPQQIEQVARWRRLLTEAGIPFTERSNGAVLLVRRPGFRADIYAYTPNERWVQVAQSCVNSTPYEGVGPFMKAYLLTQNMSETEELKVCERVFGKLKGIPNAEDWLSGRTSAGQEVFQLPKDPRTWIGKDAESTLIDEAPSVVRMGRAVNKSTTLNDEAPVAPPRGDPLKAYLTLTAMNRPQDRIFLENAPIPPAALARYALKKAPAFALDEDQERAVRVIMDPANRFVVLTGKAGTGKSTVIRALESRVRIAKCATTGKAAMGIDGITVDRLFQYDRLYDKTRSERKLAENMAACPDIIVIDEASMIGLAMMNYIFRIATRFNKRIILVGDWAQASPVKDTWPVGSQLLQSAIMVKLTKVHRQSDAPYLAALDDLRQGTVTDLVREIFAPCIVHQAPEDDHFVRLFATNKTTDSYNASRLNTGPLAAVNSVGFHPSLIDLRRASTRLEYPMEPEAIDRILDDSPFATTERFKAGARVIITMNERTEDPDALPAFVNGDTGTIVCFYEASGATFEDPGFSNPFQPTPIRIPVSTVVHLDRTGSEMEIPNQIFQAYEANGDPIYEITGMPLRLGWAVTIHRAQGLTVDKAFVDVGSIMAMIGESKHGLAYVALSRTRTLQGLQIFGWNDDAVFCAPAIKPWI